MSPEQLLILGGAGGIAILLIIASIVLTRREEDLVEVRLGQFDQDEEYQAFAESARAAQEEVDRGQSQTALTEGRKVLEPLNNLLAEKRFGKTWRRNLARANIKLTVAEFAVSHIISSAGFFTAAFLIIFPGDVIMSVVAGIVGVMAPRIYVGRAINKRLIAFETQLPDTLGLWVNALRSGYSVLQSMEAIGRDAPEPTQTEFQRVVTEVQLGIDMADALDHLLERMASDDLDLVVTAVNIQREVGGNLAEILEVISQTVRERIKLKGEIRVLTSQGRITGYVISFLPVVLALFLYLVSPSYMAQMFENRMCGWPLIGLALALIGMGTAVIQKIVDIEI